MISEELHQIILTTGLSCKIQHGEVVLEVCYFCGNERFNLGLSAEKGVYYCWACKKGGRLQEFLRLLTGQDHAIPVQRVTKTKPVALPAATEFTSLPVSAVGSAAQYLARRGITPEIATQYGIVVCVESGHLLFGRIAFPMRDFWTSELVGWIGRSYTGKSPKYLNTCVQRVITGWRTRDKDTPAVLVEGPLDGLAVHRAGFQAAVLSGIAGDVVPWASRLPLQTPILIMLDGEALQQAHQLYWQIHPVRLLGTTLVVALESGQDPASLGVAGVQEVLSRKLSSGAGTI